MEARAWVVRAGRHGEDEGSNLQEGRATIGWHEIGDLTEMQTREQVRRIVDEVFAGDHPSRQAIFAGQLWAFRDTIRAGDLILMPLKSQPGQIAFGRCTGEYAYDREADAHRRHFRPVQWQPDLVPRSALGGDLLAMVNASMTVFSPSRNDAANRLRAVAATGVDPGLSGGSTAGAGAGGDGLDASGNAGDAQVTDPAPAPTLDAIKDQVRAFVMTRFREHELTRLVAAILEALGFVCDVSPAGPDGGVDILAGSGPLGFDAPTIVVEVKSEPGAVGSAVLRTLHSAVTRYNAHHGVLVAWGGVSKPAMAEFSHLRTTIRVWDSETLLDKLFQTYPRLPEHIRAQLPLKQAWVLDDESA
ncbi:restriction endonuclease [Ornithinimicrobium pekingense]|uniref:Restriction endonuclease n=1 Tax=Ornithinimicrobium pekingense TaxID=384677 RepID=A0ABQ2F6N6_9MICO|nr:restriction endonuclease [Ornithinimicrobium pekingense]GGK64151.1 restriction endonuclease [Ornithinimicrobium pekingense]